MSISAVFSVVSVNGSPLKTELFSQKSKNVLTQCDYIFVSPVCLSYTSCSPLHPCLSSTSPAPLFSLGVLISLASVSLCSQEF